MAGVYSDVDFNRMQEQLLELREASYKSDEKCKGQEKELAILRENISLLEKELYKANQIINRSRKAKEFEMALIELESLQRKLHDHEEDWRLQNETLMRELAQLVGTNEQLEKELKGLKEKQENDGGGGCDGGETVRKEEHHALQDELRRLQAQYSALLICNKNQREKMSSQSLDNLECSNNSNRGENSEDENKEANSECTCETYPVGNNLEDLQMKLTIEEEENTLLKKQINQLELKHKEEVNALRHEVDQMTEKLKKKQESLLQLQEAKDKLFTDMNSKLETAQCEHEKLLKESQEKLNQESMSWKSSKKNLEEDLYRMKKKHTELLNENKKLEEQMMEKGYESSLEYEMKFQKQSEIILTLKEKVEHLKVQLKASNSSHQQVAEQNSALKEENEIQASKLLELTKVADKRKGLLDQLAVKYQEESDHHKEQVKELKRNRDSLVDDLKLELSQLKIQLKDLRTIEEECEGLKEKQKNVENTNNLLEQSLKDVEAKLKSTIEENNFKLSELNESHKLHASDLEEKHSHKVQELEERLIAKESEIAELREVVKKYEQMVKDHEEDKKLHEKKGSTVVKDLRKQLHSERKRADKLQEKLQEILSESKNRQSVEDLFRPIEDRLKFTDNSSLSSWSPSGLSRDNLTSQCSLQGTDEESDLTLKQENDGLVRRVGELLLKVSTLEEKVSHLESSNASMAEDLLQKTAIIDHYHMDNKAGQSSSLSSSHSNDNKMSFKKVMMDLVSDKSDDRRDMNRRLQRMLEETLTKNMHLQNDLERLSKELSDLKSGQNS